MLEEQGITNVVIEQGPLLQAAAEHGPFDIVLFAGSIAQVPANLMDFLEQGGRAIAVVAETGRVWQYGGLDPFRRSPRPAVGVRRVCSGIA